MLVVLSIIMGSIYGLIFGLMDIEDATKLNVRLLLLREEKYCFYIGILLGGIGGLANEFFRKNVKYSGIYIMII